MTGAIGRGPPPELDGETIRLLDRMYALAGQAGEPALSELAGYLSSLGPVLGRKWTDFPARSVVALVLWGAGRQAEAVDLAVASLRAGGPDDAAIQVVNNARDQLLNAAVEPLLVKRLDVARGRAEQSIARFDSVVSVAEERALVEVIDFAEAVPRERSRPAACEGRPSVIHIPVWGERFIDAAARTTLPCCLAPGNVPRLAAHGTVIIHIHTRAGDIERIRSLEVVRELSRHARFEFTPLPEPVFLASHMWGLGVWNRYVIGAAQYDSLMFARRMQADVLSLTSEWLLSSNCLTAAKELLLSGRVLVAASPIRALSEEIMQRVADLGLYRGGCLDIPADVLYRLSLEALHPAVRNMFVRKDPVRGPTFAHHLHFTTDEGFATHAIHLNPLAFSTASLPGEIGCDFHTNDTRFSSDLLDGQDPARWYVHELPPGDMYYVGLDSKAGITTFGNFETSARAVAKAAFYWVGRERDIDYFIASARHRILYRGVSGVALDLPTDCRDEAETIAELVSHLEALRPAAAERVLRYRR